MIGLDFSRFKSDIELKFEALPGPGHYQGFEIPKRKNSISVILDL